ncbi:hypothetical protein GW17_00043436 [Ensete ventricosum]|nr:hypothetical protein GW17_00043436 [Ensete ventricosum]
MDCGRPGNYRTAAITTGGHRFATVRWICNDGGVGPESLKGWRATSQLRLGPASTWLTKPAQHYSRFLRSAPSNNLELRTRKKKGSLNPFYRDGRPNGGARLPRVTTFKGTAQVATYIKQARVMRELL